MAPIRKAPDSLIKLALDIPHVLNTTRRAGLMAENIGTEYSIEHNKPYHVFDRDLINAYLKQEKERLSNGKIRRRRKPRA